MIRKHRPLSRMKLLSYEKDSPLPKTSFGYKIREARIRYRYTQKELAKKVNISSAIISLIELKGHIPKKDMILNMCLVLGLPVRTMFVRARKQQMKAKIRKDLLWCERKGIFNGRLPDFWNANDIKKYMEKNGKGSGQVL